MEIKFQNNGGGASLVAAMEKIRSISKVVSDATTKNEAGLVAPNEGRDEGLKAISKDFRNALDSTVLQSNRPEILRLAGDFFFWEEHKVGAVQAFEVRLVGEEGFKEGEDISRDSASGGFVEKGAKTIWAWAGSRVHIPVSIMNFRVVKRLIQTA